MEVELPQSMHPMSDPTDIFVWDSPLRLPNDQTIWRTRAETRGNFPGYTHRREPIKGANIRLTPNQLSVDNEQTSFAIPTSSIQRVVLESRSDQDGKSILSVDYVDSRGNIRRMWLRIGQRLLGDRSPRRDELADRLADAGVQGLEFDHVVPGFTRMRATDDQWDGPTQPPIWRADASATLASGEFPVQLSARPDAVDLTYADYRLLLPFREMLGFTVATEDANAPESVVFLAFMDSDVLIDLQLRLTNDDRPDRLSGHDVISYFRQQGIRELFSHEVGDLVSAHRLDAIEAATGPHFISSESDDIFRSENGASFDSRLAERSQAVESTQSGDANTSSVSMERPTWTRGRTTQYVRSGELHAALLENVSSEFRLCRSLYDSKLVTDLEFEQFRSRLVSDIRTIHRLIQLTLLFDWGLITDDEFKASRREVINMLTMLEAARNGA